jgi:hypothetical protein
MRKNIFSIFCIMFFVFLSQSITMEAYAQDFIFLSGGGAYSCDFEAANPCSADWLTDSPWSLTTEASHGGAQSMTDSPNTDYADNIDVSLTLNTTVNLVSASNPQLKFWHKYALESEYDYGYLEVSSDNGLTWYYLAYFTGVSGWTREQIDLSDYIGSSIKIRFRLITDESVVMDGWHIDDVSIAESPTPVTMNTPSNPTCTTLDLSWTQNSDTDFASYKIYRSETSPVTSTSSTLIATINDQATTTFTDTGLRSSAT